MIGQIQFNKTKFVIFQISKFSTRQWHRTRFQPPPDCIVPEKSSPSTAPDFSRQPEAIEKFFNEIVNGPRSKMKLPVSLLIKDQRNSEKYKKLSISCDDADKALDLIRQDNSEIVPRQELFSSILNAYALEGMHEKAETLVLNLEKDFGVAPSYDLMSFLALAYLNGGRKGSAIKVLSKIPQWNEVAQTIYKHLISEYLKNAEAKKAENLFEVVRQHCSVPSPELTGMLLMNYGKTDRVELGIKVYHEVVAAGMESNPVTHAAMVFLCTRKKDFFSTAIQFYDQMRTMKFPMHLRVHNYMLQGCSKASDLPRAISIWNELVEGCKSDPRLTPNEFSLSSVLWALASAETSETKLSKRDFHYDLKCSDIVETAKSIYKQGLCLVKPNSHVSNGYLAVLTNNLAVEDAEEFFHHQMVDCIKRTVHSYELMFKMYDAKRDFSKTLALKEKMESESLVVPFEGWRAMIRTAALNNEVDTAMIWLEEMNKHGYIPSVEDLKVLKLRLFELRKFILKPKFDKLCLPEPEIPQAEPKAWKERSVAIGQFLESLYGRNAPKICTQLSKK